MTASVWILGILVQVHRRLDCHSCHRSLHGCCGAWNHELPQNPVPQVVTQAGCGVVEDRLANTVDQAEQIHHDSTPVLQPLRRCPAEHSQVAERQDVSLQEALEPELRMP